MKTLQRYDFEHAGIDYIYYSESYDKALKLFQCEIGEIEPLPETELNFND